jgi:CheY-like chemotaxis protein
MKKHRSTRVLIADDEHLIADTLALILNHHGFEAHAVYSGEGAVERALLVAPDILVSDILMRGITGIEAAQRIREDCPWCRVILFSGGMSEASAKTANFDFDFLAKPVHPEALLACLNKSGD